MEKLDYKKEFKELYLPKNKPAIVDVPAMSFAVIDGEGDPNVVEFSTAVEALYSFSYAVKMSYKSDEVPEGYYDYTVFPLEGEWDLLDKSKPETDKSNFSYSIMIRQPDFITEELFERFLNEAKKKKSNPYLDKIECRNISEGLCCQIMHIGSYDDEHTDFEIMEKYCADNGYERISKAHREIYISDPRKTVPDKLKTVLRFKVKEQ
jgi:hypothetical protein